MFAGWVHVVSSYEYSTNQNLTCLLNVLGILNLNTICLLNKLTQPNTFN